MVRPTAVHILEALCVRHCYLRLLSLALIFIPCRAYCLIYICVFPSTSCTHRSHVLFSAYIFIPMYFAFMRYPYSCVLVYISKIWIPPCG